MLSGRNTVVAAEDYWEVEDVLAVCRERLGLADDDSTMELWDLSGEKVHDETTVQDWPSIQPKGEISEYQLLLRR
eukprot:6460625-Amphidinium_carterae.1